MKKRISRKHATKSPDKILILTIFSLLIIGLVLIYSSTVVHSHAVFGDPFRFVVLQLGWILIGLAGFWFFYKFNYKYLEKPAYIFMLVSLVFLVILTIFGFLPCEKAFPFAPCINEANRWIYLNPDPFPNIPLLGILSFQPSELAKLSLILYLAVQLTKSLKTKKDSFWIYILTTGIVSFFVLLQPNMSTAILIFIIGSIMYFTSGASLKPLIYIVPVFIVLAVLMIIISPYRRQRVVTFIKGEDVQTTLTTSYQVNQVSIALGSGGLFGVGFGKSKQKYQYIPEIASDSIFAIIGEEFGFVGTTFFIGLFCILIYRGIEIAKRSRDTIGKLLAVGVTSWIGVQFLIHVAANSGVIPYTGVPMPLISYGGSSMVFSLISLGILANVSKNTDT